MHSGLLSRPRLRPRNPARRSRTASWPLCFFAYGPRRIARRSRLCVIICTRFIGPVGARPVRPGACDPAARRALALQKIVDALKIKFRFRVRVERGGPVLRDLAAYPGGFPPRPPPGRTAWVGRREVLPASISPGIWSPRSSVRYLQTSSAPAFATTQSPPPLTGSTFRPPLSRPSSGPCSGSRPFSFCRRCVVVISAHRGRPEK